MNKKISYLLSLVLLCSLVLLTNCGKDDDDGDPAQMTDQQKAAKALADGSPWQVTTVVSMPEETTDEESVKSIELSFDVSGTDATTAPSGFEASSSGDFFNSDSDATWSWEGAGTSAINLTGSSVDQLTGIQFSPNSEAPTSITLTFELTEVNARASGIGSYTVILE